MLCGVLLGIMVARGSSAQDNRAFNRQCVAAYQAIPERRAAPGFATFSGHRRFPESRQVASAVMTLTRKANPQKVKFERLNCVVTPGGMVVISPRNPAVRAAAQ